MNRMNNKGMTLVELLTGLAVSSIFIVSIYGVFISGYSLYEKTSSLGSARDETDYIATMIFNEMSEQKPDFVEPYSNGNQKGVKLIRLSDKEVESYLIRQPDTSDDTYIYFEENKIWIDTITKEEKETYGSAIAAGDEPELVLEGETIQILTGSDQSFLQLRCSSEACNERESNGIIELELAILPQNERVAERMNPVTLQSSFGF
ncbi:PilW family protein [Jeotgalibacillus proteolyticus]|uniref:PilW family protein n=1 Tax=Jeotgalibacillus proteolyticus TaxID=2082395 RepID=UPI003CF429FA